jgi:hypothetical protein
MITILQSLLAALHLTAIGLAAAGPMLVAVMRLSGRLREDGMADRLLWRVGVWATAATLIAALVGLAAGLLRVESDRGAYFAMLSRFTPRAYYLLAVEWLFSLLCYGVWIATWQRWRQKPLWHAAIALMGATNLLYHFPPLMIAQNLLASDPTLVAEHEISRPLALGLMTTPLVVAKTVHIWGASLVVAATSLLLAAATHDANFACSKQFVRWAGLSCLAGVVAQWFSGIATLLLLSDGRAQAMTGSSLPATGLLVLGVLLTLQLMLNLARQSLNPVRLVHPGRLVALVGSIMLTMSLASRW